MDISTNYKCQTLGRDSRPAWGKRPGNNEMVTLMKVSLFEWQHHLIDSLGPPTAV